MINTITNIVVGIIEFGFMVWAINRMSYNYSKSGSSSTAGLIKLIFGTIVVLLIGGFLILYSSVFVNQFLYAVGLGY